MSAGLLSAHRSQGTTHPHVSKSPSVAHSSPTALLQVHFIQPSYLNLHLAGTSCWCAFGVRFSPHRATPERGSRSRGSSEHLALGVVAHAPDSAQSTPLPLVHVGVLLGLRRPQGPCAVQCVATAHTAAGWPVWDRAEPCTVWGGPVLNGPPSIVSGQDTEATRALWVLEPVDVQLRPTQLLAGPCGTGPSHAL